MLNIILDITVLNIIYDEKILELYQVIIENEKNYSEKIVNFSMLLIGAITFLATIAGILITIYGVKIKRSLDEHQEKINLVLNSKKFDNKIQSIDEKLKRLRILERKIKRYDLNNEYKSLSTDIHGYSEYINLYKKSPIKEQILLKNEYEHLIEEIRNLSKGFCEKMESELTDENDSDENYLSIEEEMEAKLEELEACRDELIKIYNNLELATKEQST